MSDYEWTGDDAAFAGRVSAALTRLDIPAADLDEWRECCRRWGPRSRSALGCLVGFVRVAWDPWMQFSIEEGSWFPASVRIVVAAALPHKFIDELIDDALLDALEAAPR